MLKKNYFDQLHAVFEACRCFLYTLWALLDALGQGCGTGAAGAGIFCQGPDPGAGTFCSEQEKEP